MRAGCELRATSSPTISAQARRNGGNRVVVRADRAGRPARRSPAASFSTRADRYAARSHGIHVRPRRQSGRQMCRRQEGLLVVSHAGQEAPMRDRRPAPTARRRAGAAALPRRARASLHIRRLSARAPPCAAALAIRRLASERPSSASFKSSRCGPATDGLARALGHRPLRGGGAESAAATPSAVQCVAKAMSRSYVTSQRSRPPVKRAVRRRARLRDRALHELIARQHESRQPIRSACGCRSASNSGSSGAGSRSSAFFCCSALRVARELAIVMRVRILRERDVEKAAPQGRRAGRRAAGRPART